MGVDLYIKNDILLWQKTIVKMFYNENTDVFCKARQALLVGPPF
jgi:hypothetical protein